MRSVSTRSESRLWRFLLMIVFCAFMTPLSLSAQKINLSMKNVTVQDAITALNQSENYSIILNADEVDLGKRINISAKNATIDEVLSQVFAGLKFQSLFFSSVHHRFHGHIQEYVAIRE